MPLLKQVVEALVFASQKPLVPREIAAALKAAAEESEDPETRAFGKTREAEIGAVLEEIKIELDGSGHAFQLIEQVTGWHFVTSGACAPWVRQLFPESKPIRLSGPALETLAIIAYRQPITRADIEAVRGVAVDGMVNMLLERGLIRIAGRADVPGRPLLYESTEYFLQHFGLKTLDELPNSTELRRIPLPVAEPAPQPEPPTAEPAPESALPDLEPAAQETSDSTPTPESPPPEPLP
jgi:segregation and condensation protein B